MGKRVLIGFIALTSAVVLYGGTADAQSCLSWARVGGSSICCAWSPKGVAAEVTFKQACTVSAEGEGGGFTTCNATADVIATDNVAFCTDLNNPTKVVKVDCPRTLHYQQVLQTDCDSKHEKDVNPGPGVGTGHEHHGGCTQRLVLLAACPQDCCDTARVEQGVPAGACQDVTPIEMDTRVVAQVFPPIGLRNNGLLDSPVLAQESETPACSPDSPVCVFTQHCSINPNKIPFIQPPSLEGSPTDPILIANQKYQCEFTCASDNLYDCPLFVD
jgi:hypothetical protein